MVCLKVELGMLLLSIEVWVGCRTSPEPRESSFRGMWDSLGLSYMKIERKVKDKFSPGEDT